MGKVILLKKNKNYVVDDDCNVTPELIPKIKFILFDNSTPTKANTFAMIKAKNINFELSPYLVQCNIWNGYDDTIAEYDTYIASSSLSNKYSVYPLITQFWSILEVVNIDFIYEVLSYDIRVTKYDKNGDGIEYSWNSMDDDLFDDIEDHCGNSYVSKLHDDRKVILLFPDKTWDVVSIHHIDLYANFAYIGIPSSASSLVTLLQKDDFDLIDQITEIRGIAFIGDNGSCTLDILGSCEWRDAGDILDFITLAPQSLRFLNTTGNVGEVECYTIEIFLRAYDFDNYSTEITPDIDFQLSKEQIQSGEIALLPIILELLREYDYMEG